MLCLCAEQQIICYSCAFIRTAQYVLYAIIYQKSSEI